MASVKIIVDGALCCGCGACSRTCRIRAITYVRNEAGYIIPRVLENCVNCGQCLRVCPSIDMETVMQEVEGDPFVGTCISGYIGHASDGNLRREGQSGGVVSAFLIWLLKSGKIDGAVVNHFDEKTQRNKAIYVNTEKDILAGVGSYYAQSTVVDTVLANKGKRLAVVALGCQAQALHRLRKIDVELAKNLLVLGLVCGGNYSGDYIDDLVSLAATGRDDIASKMRFRYKSKHAGGWPGKVCVWFGNKAAVLPSVRRIERKELYALPRCKVCFDRMNVFSDVVFGDPWGIGRKDNRKGNTVAIVRTCKGRDLFEDFVASGYVDGDFISPDVINAGQRVNEVTRANFYSLGRDVKFEFAKRIMLSGSRFDIERTRRERLLMEQRKNRRLLVVSSVAKVFKPILLLRRFLKGSRK